MTEQRKRVHLLPLLHLLCMLGLAVWCRLLAMLASPFLAIPVLRWTATSDLFVAPIHRRLWANPHYAQAGLVYRAFITTAVAANVAWVLGAIRNLITITAARHSKRLPSHDWDKKIPPPPWPYKRDSFAVILGELQDRGGSRVPNQHSPHMKPSWLVLPELSLYTGSSSLAASVQARPAPSPTLRSSSYSASVGSRPLPVRAARISLRTRTSSCV